MEMRDYIPIKPHIEISHATLYEQCLKRQFELHQKVLEGNLDYALICTSHREVYTMGRGVRSKLVDGVENATPILPYPQISIGRAGGRTFHYPQQWIAYPIIKLRPTSFSLKDHLRVLLDCVVDYFNNAFDLGAKTVWDPLGVWVGDRKVASLGIQIQKSVTLHGIACNLGHHPEIHGNANNANLCGLNSAKYSCLENFIKEKYQFQQHFKALTDNLVAKYETFF